MATCCDSSPAEPRPLRRGSCPLRKRSAYREATIGRARTLLVGLFLALTLAAPGAATGPATGVARLEAPAGAETVLKVVASLPVLAVPVAPGDPVAKGTVLVEMDLKSLERAVGEARDRLAEEQQKSRGRSSTRVPASRGNTDQLIVNQDEMAAMSDLMELQTRLSTASPRAPEDGYVLQNFYATGAQAKRRKPLVSFVAGTRTRVRIALDDGAAATYPPGSEVTVISREDGARRFRCAVVQSTVRGAGAAELELRPLELPFLSLDRPAPVTIETTP